MRFCVSHWEGLKKRIADRGLAHLVAKNDQVALEQIVDHLERRGEASADDFDPLMLAHWAIASNALTLLEAAGVNPLYLFTRPEHMPEGRSTCPVCELNFFHRACTDLACVLDKERGYDWTLDTAADEALKAARQLGLVE